jgi:2-dehydro-3-deoxy-D-arabinonate dehydratase
MLTTERDDEITYEDSTSTAEMVTTCEELVSYLGRHNNLPETLVLLAGTCTTEPSTLLERDRISIDIDRIGRLVNVTVTIKTDKRRTTPRIE